MGLNELKKERDIENNKKLQKVYAQFGKLIDELNKKELTDDVTRTINSGIEEINSLIGSEKEQKKRIRRTQTKIIQLVEKEHKLVTINHYRNMWLAIGMSAFGIPLGVVFGATLDNMGFIGIGLPIGMAVGMAIGSGMDKKALEQGRQLDLEIAY